MQTKPRLASSQLYKKLGHSPLPLRCCTQSCTAWPPVAASARKQAARVCCTSPALTAAAAVLHPVVRRVAARQEALHAHRRRGVGLARAAAVRDRTGGPHVAAGAAALRRHEGGEERVVRGSAAGGAGQRLSTLRWMIVLFGRGGWRPPAIARKQHCFRCMRLQAELRRHKAPTQLAVRQRFCERAVGSEGARWQTAP